VDKFAKLAVKVSFMDKVKVILYLLNFGNNGECHNVRMIGPYTGTPPVMSQAARQDPRVYVSK